MEDCKLSLISHPAHIRQSSFDVLKCVAAFLVVAIHYGPYWINPINIARTSSGAALEKLTIMRLGKLFMEASKLKVLSRERLSISGKF